MRNVFVLAAVMVALSVGYAKAALDPYVFSTGETGKWNVKAVKRITSGTGSLDYLDAGYGYPGSTGYDTAAVVPSGSHGWASKYPTSAYPNFPSEAGDTVNWISTDVSGMDYNGYYAYQYKFDKQSNVDEVVTIFRAYVFTDDHIDAVYLNGKEITFTAPAQDFKGWYNLEFIVDDTSMFKLDATDNEIVFITHNNNSESKPDQYDNRDPNPTGFASVIEITTIEEFGVIPEPATIGLIGLGMLGAGFAARRRNRK